MEKKQRKVSLDENHKWHTEFPWWIGPFTEINWIDAKDPRGAENCSAMDENLRRASAATSSQAYFVLQSYLLHVRLVKMCWQPLFIPLNKSRYFFFFVSELKCLLINLGQKEEQKQLFKWKTQISFCHHMKDIMCWSSNDEPPSQQVSIWWRRSLVVLKTSISVTEQTQALIHGLPYVKKKSWRCVVRLITC